MGSERALWKTISRNMREHWKATRIENPANPGTPDVYFTMGNGAMGWLELKHAHQWPKRADTPLKIEHFTPEQRRFIRDHGRLGAKVYVLLQVDRDYFLMKWRDALRIGEMVKADYYKIDFFWRRSVNYRHLIYILGL
jgi:hypothetical protein